jgi:hypothetical protein
MTRIKPKTPINQSKRFAGRIWHKGAQKYLYASDYGIKGFPIGR